MQIKPAGAVVLAALAAAAIGAGAVTLLDGRDSTGPANMVNKGTAARTSFPGLTPATDDPTLAGLADASPAAGKVVQVAGPFDDRFSLRSLAFDGRKVSGSVLVTSDVSEVLDLQVIAGFYSRTGALLGTGTYSFHLDESHTTASGVPVETMPFTVKVPASLQGEAVSAAVGVPVLVNE